MAEIDISDVLRRARKNCSGTSKSSTEGRAVLAHIEQQAAEIERQAEEIERLRGALTEIHGEFVDGSCKLYTTPDSTLDRIRATAKNALEGTK